MGDTKQPAPAGLTLSDLKDRKARCQFIAAHSLSEFEKLVAVKARERSELIRNRTKENLEASKRATTENLARLLKTKF